VGERRSRGGLSQRSGFSAAPGPGRRAVRVTVCSLPASFPVLGPPSLSIGVWRPGIHHANEGASSSASRAGERAKKSASTLFGLGRVLEGMRSQRSRRFPAAGVPIGRQNIGPMALARAFPR
jgi:hypothetical protein